MGDVVPYELVHLDFTRTSEVGKVFASSSNGLASGNSKLEAICHGICEVVERDATTLWHLAGESAHFATQIDLTTIDDPVSLDLIDRFGDADALVAVWDTTSDIGVPAFLFHEGDEPVAQRAFKEIARLTRGACCSFDAGSAGQLRDQLSAVAVYAAGAEINDTPDAGGENLQKSLQPAVGIVAFFRGRDGIQHRVFSRQ